MIRTSDLLHERIGAVPIQVCVYNCVVVGSCSGCFVDGSGCDRIRGLEKQQQEDVVYGKGRG